MCPNDDTGTEEERRPYLEVVRTNVQLCSKYFVCRSSLYHFSILFKLAEYSRSCRTSIQPCRDAIQESFSSIRWKRCSVMSLGVIIGEWKCVRG